ncbi:MAG: DNA oxidative demethylase AlkB [Pseudomonadota bacterium]
MTADLFEDQPPAPGQVHIAPGAVLLRGFALEMQIELLQAFEAVIAEAPLRHLVTPGGYTMSVAMTNCGPLGWVSDRRGYRYQATDPVSNKPWPAMPALWRELARRAADAAGYAGFEADACLVNSYAPGAKLSLHQDRDEKDMAAPIVSVSLGLPASFLFGTDKRADRPQRFRLASGDVVVWGGASRLAYHGIVPLADGEHPLTGSRRINLTFRKVN